MPSKPMHMLLHMHWPMTGATYLVRVICHMTHLLSALWALGLRLGSEPSCYGLSSVPVNAAVTTTEPTPDLVKDPPPPPRC